MKKYHIYEVFNYYGDLLYVGMTTKPKKRFYQHTKVKPNPNNGSDGLFYKEKVFFEIVKVFEDRKVALWYEGYLKYKYGFHNEVRIDGAVGGDKAGKIAVETGQIYEANLKSIKKSRKPVIAYDLKGNKIGEYEGQRVAARALGIDAASIHYILTGKTQNPKYYYFEWAKKSLK